MDRAEIKAALIAGKESRKNANKGFTLIELLVGISVMAIVGLMMTSLFGSSTRLYRSTISYSNIQTESQTVSRRISNTVMGARSLYLNEGEKGTYLFTGEVTEEAGKAKFSGEMLWFNKETNCLYQNSGFLAEEDSGALEEANSTGEEEGSEENLQSLGALSPDTVRKAFEENASKGREYLISDKVQELKFTIYPVLTEKERIGDTGYFYKTEGKVTVDFAITFQYLDSKSYSVDTSATPRNRLAVLWWNGSGDGEDGRQ
ncbi:PilW family protein [Clostridium transplantifaecale]|uniref:PilW family protein n=1 Tax=Clostridium transplantifaecale TaxID=2479838 RepID=UPI000F6312F0|nr:prepilin-type N-terminal cleavage/methylation domain-containing protein [Clostridium transplantifaecale]